MIVKGPIKIYYHIYGVTIKDISIDPADRSVGIMSDVIDSFTISKLEVKGRRVIGGEKKDIETQIYEHVAANDVIGDEIEDEIWDELYKIENKKNEESYKRAKKRGYKGTKRDFMSEFT